MSKNVQARWGSQNKSPEALPRGFLFCLLLPAGLEHSATLRAHRARTGGRISFEILPTRAVRLEVCRLVQVQFKVYEPFFFLHSPTHSPLPLERPRHPPRGNRKKSAASLSFSVVCLFLFASCFFSEERVMYLCKRCANGLTFLLFHAIITTEKPRFTALPLFDMV